jgi:hypothetical protein
MGKQKFAYTSVDTRTEAGQTIVDDIQVGGTRTILVFKR